MTAPALQTTDFRSLTRTLADALSQIERSENVSKTLEVILESLIERFQEELGFEGGRIYVRERDEFVLCCGMGSSRGVPIGIRVPRDYPPHVRTLADGAVVMRRGEPGLDSEFERTVGVSSTFAAIAVGEGNSHVIAFTIKGDVKEDLTLYALTAVRHVITMKLQQQRLSGLLEESRLIQESLLPAGPPVFEGFDIAARSRPAESVGGDLFDYIPLAEDRLGIAIGDSSGHGLPAALLARDVVTGLRMGVGGTARIVPTIERLNQVIHRAALSSRFASLFYGELRRDGSFAFCNAGHNPPLLRRRRSFVELARGGTVLGPIPTARYRSTRVRLGAGDVVVMYTDGVVEREDRGGEMYGTGRLRRLLRRLEGRGAGEMVEAVLAAVDEHGGSVPVADDLTVLVVRRT